MEAVLSAPGPQTDVLVSNLKFGLDPQGSYCQNRRSSTTFSNVNSASPNSGVKVVTINIGSSSEWLDPQSVVLAMNITNTGTADLFPASGCVASLFERLQIRLGSSLVEDIQDFGKLTVAMEEHSMSSQKKLAYDAIGFGTEPLPSTHASFFSPGQHLPLKLAHEPGNNNANTKRVHMKFNLSGLFSQHRWIYLGALGGSGLQIQLTLSDPTDSLITRTTLNSTNTDYSTSYTLSDIKILADLCTLNDDLQASFNSALLSGQELRIPIKSWETVVNYLPSTSAGSFDVPISKNYTRLASMFAIFNKAMDAQKSGLNKHVNSGYFPTTHAEDFEYYLQLGSKRVPDHSVRGVSEAWYRLQRVLGIEGSLAHTSSVSMEAYKSTRHMIGIENEKLPMLMATGENLSTGQTIFLKVKGMGSTETDVPTKCTICMHFEKIISVQDTITEVYD